MPQSAVVIEDEADIRSLISLVLESAGYNVHAADNGLDGVELVRRVSPEVVTLDISMPGIDGYETARRIRRFSDTHIIMITAFVQESDAQEGLDAGADEYLRKPFRPRELRARIEALTTTRRPE
ncbi:response regulator receiver domain-containing protein [Microbacterium sp. SLBN-154]|uniref:response regulator transcription factor n=1 Tax=Microbacterium sp. SLBN-154 TaxID=2768458 RepID=UPI00116D41F2|nr:response regulator [Microbacterium sp. SLBN-154]TQK19395.1 response regulator receiver domain-containing protein [Microbacterium sp. SLBN-154]